MAPALQSLVQEEGSLRMTTREENELLTQIGPGTPMGALMR
jgi:hypothetical protein